MPRHRAELLVKNDDGDRIGLSRRYRTQGCGNLIVAALFITMGFGAMEGAWAILGVGLLLFGGLMLVGAFWSFVRVEDVRLDLEAGTLRQRSGLWPVAGWRARPLDAVEAVTRTVEERATDDEGGSETVHLVTLEFTEDDPVTIRAVMGDTAAHRLTERLARGIDAHAVDRTGAEEIRRRPDRLDESLADRWAREEGDVDPDEPVPRPPPDSGFLVREARGRARITLPRRTDPRDWVITLVVAGSALWPLSVLAFVVLTGRSLDEGLFVGLMGLIFAVGSVVVIRDRFSSFVIEEDGDRIRLHRELAGRRIQGTEIAKDDVEIVDVGGTTEGARGGASGRVRIRTDDGTHGIGRHLTRTELAWLRETVTRLAVRR